MRLLSNIFDLFKTIVVGGYDPIEILTKLFISVLINFKLTVAHEGYMTFIGGSG